MTGTNTETIGTLSMSEFAAQLNITPKYLRDVCKRPSLQIAAQQDPRNKSRKLLTPEQQRLIRSELGRNTAPEHRTGTPEPIYTGELILMDCEPAPLDGALMRRRQTDRELEQISQAIGNQMHGLDSGLDAFCANIETTVEQKVIRAGANGISRGLNALNQQVSNAGKPQPVGVGGS